MIHGPDNQIFVFGGSAAAVPFAKPVRQLGPLRLTMTVIFLVE